MRLQDHHMFHHLSFSVKAQYQCHIPSVQMYIVRWIFEKCRCWANLDPFHSSFHPCLNRKTMSLYLCYLLVTKLFYAVRIFGDWNNSYLPEATTHTGLLVEVCFSNKLDCIDMSFTFVIMQPRKGREVATTLDDLLMRSILAVESLSLNSLVHFSVIINEYKYRSQFRGTL